MEMTMKKTNISRIATAALAVAMLFSLAAPAMAAEHNTDVNYVGLVDAGTSSYTITVPASISVDGAAGNVKIQGYTAQAVKLTCPNSVEMTDAIGNKLTANVILADEENAAQVVLPISLVESGTATGTVKSTWDNAPEIGTWTGNLEYTVANIANN